MRLFKLLLLLTLLSAVASKECSTTDASYYCPNCGGIQVNDCLDCAGYQNADSIHNLCINRRLFDVNYEHYHFLWNDIVGAIVWFLVAGVATACGVGGGGIYVPLGILLLRFAPKPASGLSQASIFGAILGGLILNLPAHHPDTKIRNVPMMQHDPSESSSPTNHDEASIVDGESEEEYLEKGGKFYTRPLINYDMALFLSPMQMAGAVLGVLVQKILPNWLYLLIAGVVLAFTGYKTYTKFWDVHKKEKQQRKKQKKALEHNPSSSGERTVVVEMGHDDHAISDNDEILEMNNDASEKNENNHDAASNKLMIGKNKTNASKPTDMMELAPLENVSYNVEENDAAEPQDKNLEATETAQKETETEEELRHKYLEDDMRQYPREKLIALVVLWVGLLLLTLFKGGQGVESLVGITCESPWYGIFIALQFLWLFGFSLLFGRKLLVEQKQREAVRFPYLDDDPVWNAKTLRFYGMFTFIAGIVAGLTGIGGGMVLGPVMLVMGIHPRVSSAVNATMVVLTSSSVAFIFVISGLVPWSYAVFYFLVCLFGAFVGKRRIDRYIKRTGRASLLIFILATIITLATAGCIVILLTGLADQDWCLDGFNKFCTVQSKETCVADRMLGGFDFMRQPVGRESFVLSSSHGY